ncbi:MAG: hypothetical protein MJ094_05490 [Saccharofermentans sp.]|nr:hypothetical protein [Saccharofermentans sp.]
MKTDLMKKKDFFEGRNRRLSNLRLVFFILTVAFVCLGFFAKHLIPFVCLSVLTVVVFAYLCFIHGKSKNELKLILSKIECLDRYESRSKGDFSNLKDNGKEFINPLHDYASDLDLFGEHSVFALYNTSHFILGRKAFADMLCGKDLDKLTKHDVIKRQDFVSKLSNSLEFLINYEAISNLNKIIKLPSALINLANSKEIINNSNKLLYKLSPLMWFIPLVLFVLGNKFYKASILFVILVNLIIWFFTTRKYSKDFVAIGKVSSQASALAKRINFFFDETGSINDLFGDFLNNDASKNINNLRTACAYCAIRQQPIVALILNCVFPYDLLCADMLFSWRKEYGDKFLKDLDGVANIEALMSACSPGLSSSYSCIPVICDEKLAYFCGTDMIHPLLDPQCAVSNSIELDSQSVLITGSNMSGKTTLIRTVGLISIIAYTGARVPASSASLSIMRVMSSMRIIDSIEGNMSTFKAELVRIGNIVKASEEGKPMMFLIDEIFRGTNSADRTDGAEAVLNKLKRPYITGFMTTHDYALCNRVTSKDGFENVAFYHFSEKYEGENIIFDYKLKTGISNESNAKFLMGLVGII